MQVKIPVPRLTNGRWDVNLGIFDMREIATGMLTAVVLVAAGCVRGPKREADLGAVRAEILALENQWATAIERQDAAAFERLAAEDFRFIEEDGRVLNRAQYIADRSHNPDSVESAVQDQIEVRLYGHRHRPFNHSRNASRSTIRLSLSLEGHIRTTRWQMASSSPAN